MKKSVKTIGIFIIAVFLLTACAGDDSDSTVKTRIVKIYQPDENGMEIISIEKEIKDEQDIWQELINASILDENCEILDFQVNEGNSTIDLNFNKAVGDRIRSMGTTGEAEIIGCLMNTYLEAYDCEKIQLMEEGGSLKTGHGVITGYHGWYEF